ncbi:MAG: D-glycero-alpha-D-manno-heptose-1,7-bisphosphate 7-phosphatase [Bacteroidota bacterium]
MATKAVFLDRDGVVNKEIGDYVKDMNDFQVNSGVLQAIKKLKTAGFVVVIISNQGGIARGLYDKNMLGCLHDILCQQLEHMDTFLDEIYVCPHHDAMEKCLCRKPSGLLLEKAIARFDVDKKQAVFIGDADRDVEAAENAGIKGVKIESNSNILSLTENLISEFSR